MFTLNIKGKLFSSETPVVMGIINITPDSFYAGSRNINMDQILENAGKMLEEGAAFLDFGGQSTRPSAELLTAAEEMERVIPAIQAVSKSFPAAIISIDTFYAEVARTAIEAGAGMVNDISGGEMDIAMIETVAALQTPYICMHMKGTPQTMQNLAAYNNVTTEVFDYFAKKISDCEKAGIHDIIIDPGFGFAKNAAHNFQLLREMKSFSVFKKPVMAGLSRKSTVYKTLETTAENALNGTTVLNTIAILKGASILRVHDVKEAVECVKLCFAYQKII
ncbi:MAG: dihydropteroate synthase [Chitinophagaceae bacterium]|nr:dihydropteroate synthase [Chitinophagaceae bacterium]